MFIVSCLISFIAGMGIMFVIKNPKQEPEIKEQKPEIKNTKLVCIDKMFQEININGALPIKLSASVLTGLKQIAQTPEWYTKIDKETTENLYKIYQKWQAHLKGTNNDLTNVSEGGGFHRIKFWEGTYEEYKKALENHEINEQTKVNIIEETGSFISMDSDGQIEEYME